ncbi:DUF1045 domain-containing protein [Sagittula sp. NFXS13]|uniref:DUF1045 domain-containing protein n=1 Tax=Sagittula sp. NFXS13 TaxID=2819095 RepID=UPI0032DF2FC2
MSQHSRFAIYYMPSVGALADFGAQWLGWDAQAAKSRAQPDVPGIAALTDAPRKYGFHGTLKPPFRLRQGRTEADLRAAVADLASRTAPAQADSLVLTRFGRWFALTPTGDTSGIGRVAAACVTELDDFRAAATEAELAKRRKGGLSETQDAHLTRWGYPFVLDQFRFHLTLTGKAPAKDLDTIEAQIQMRLPTLPQPFLVSDICLSGERADGRFELLHRYTLSG